MVQEHALGSTSYTLTIEVPKTFGGLENEENQAIFDALRDDYKVILKHHLPSISKCLTMLTKTGAPEEVIRRAIDQKNQLIRYKEKCELLGIEATIHHSDDMDDVNDTFLEIEPVTIDSTEAPTSMLDTQQLSRNEEQSSDEHHDVEKPPERPSPPSLREGNLFIRTRIESTYRHLL
jgi:hypothetical protein